MKKKLLTILLSIFMFIATFATRVFADEHDHSGWTNWGDDASEQTTLPSTAGDYYLTHDVNISSTWNVPGTTNLCLNGYVINANSGNFSVITIANGATLNLYDCGTTTHNGYIDTSGLWHLDKTNSHSLTTGEIALPIVGGIVTGSIDSNCAGGLNVNNSTLNIYGGNISGNKVSANADSDGGGIGIYAGSKVNMYGGSIIGNYARRRGGGVACYGNNSEFNMRGGIITNNHGTDGGGVFVANSGIFNMHDGTICNNDAQNCGGGVNVQSIFNMLNGTIEYNIAKPNNDCWGGGGIAFYGNGKGTLVSGKIQYNSSTVNGGGILFLEANNTTGNVSLSGVSITNNIATVKGGGIFVDNSPVEVLFGGNTIIKGNKLNNGNVSNLHLGREETNKTSNLNIDSSSTKAMDIGLSGRSIKVKNATNADVTYFFADDEEYDAYYNSEDGGFIELSYKITDGTHSTINISKDEDTLFTSTAAYSEFFDGTNIKSGCGVKIDGSFIDPLNYTHESGSTKITLKSSYLSTLSIGNHTLSIVSLDGHADTRFTITRNTPSPTPAPEPDSTPRYAIPNTGVEGTPSNNHSLLKLSSLSLLAIGIYMVIKKKKDN